MKCQQVQTPEQIRAVAGLARQIWREHYSPIIGAAQVEYMLEKFQSEAAIARQIHEGGCEYYLWEDVGYLALVPDRANGRLQVSKIYVLASRRKQGAGRLMMEWAEKRAHELGCREIWLTVNRHNTGSLAFYEKMGFQKAGAVVTDIGGGFVMDDWRMTKRLAAGERGNSQ